MSLFYMFLCLISFVKAEDLPQKTSLIKTTLLSEVTAMGQKVTGLALEYESNVLSGTDLRQLYQVETSLDNQGKLPRSVIRAYVNNGPKTAYKPNVGKFVIIELDDRDKNADLYSLKNRK